MNTAPDSGCASPARLRCARCLRPSSACICAGARPVPTAVQVLILMHPLEQHQAKGTGRLLHLCLPGRRILVGETFAPQELAQALEQPWDGADTSPRRTLLLYPPTPPGGPLPVAPAPPLPPGWLEQPRRLRLVVLDGTWRKSRRMLWANPPLQTLPRLALANPPASRYVIRKAHAAHQRSTLEAVQHALQQLEPANPSIALLGRAMDAFLALQSRHLPATRPVMLEGPLA